MRTVVHIDRLVLTGLPRSDAPGVAAGLKQELERAFRDAAMMQSLLFRRDVPWLQGGDVQVEHGSTPPQLGRAVANAIRREVAR